MVSKSAPEDAPKDAPKADALTSRLSRKGAAARPLELLLRVEGASSTPAVLRLGAERCSVGSASSCDLVVHHATVSRVHLELHLVAEGVRVRDVGSSVGT
jgi:pSer/pThr/pTyr-binding forkhead associated (FHA) protein